LLWFKRKRSFLVGRNNAGLWAFEFRRERGTSLSLYGTVCSMWHESSLRQNRLVCQLWSMSVLVSSLWILVEKGFILRVYFVCMCVSQQLKRIFQWEHENCQVASSFVGAGWDGLLTSRCHVWTASVFTFFTPYYLFLLNGTKGFLWPSTIWEILRRKKSLIHQFSFWFVQAASFVEVIRSIFLPSRFSGVSNTVPPRVTSGDVFFNFTKKKERNSEVCLLRYYFDLKNIKNEQFTGKVLVMPLQTCNRSEFDFVLKSRF